MAINCSACGYAYNSDQAQQCSICATSLAEETSLLESAPENPPIEHVAASPVSPVTNPTSYPTNNLANDTNVVGVSPCQPDQRAGTVLEGRITHIERFDEKPSFDIYKVFSKLLLGIMFFVPFFVLFSCSLVVCFSFAAIGFRGLSQLFNPLVWTTTGFNLLELFLLRRFRGGDTVPVYRGMIENNSGQEYNFMIQGPLRAGNLVVGHNIELHGRWRRGTFFTKRGQDQTASSEISPDFSTPWKFILLATLTLFVCLGFVGYSNWPELVNLVNF